jgi:hypothetical protein
LEAEVFAQKRAGDAQKITQVLGVVTTPVTYDFEEGNDEDEAMRPPTVKRIPNQHVRLFGGLEYTGTYVGEVNESGAPHGLGMV